MTPQLIPILFENEHFVVVDKPAGWLAVPSQWGKEDPRPVLGMRLIEQMKQNVIPVHRLDLEVTGVTLFAKNERSHKIASGWFETREIDKMYEAWGEGEAPADAKPGIMFEWSCHIHRGKKRAFEAPHGKLAVTRAYWKGTLDFNGQKVQHWHLDPLTGRPHQLRYELSRHNNPIVGDALYGAKLPFMESTIALRAVRLNFGSCSRSRELGVPAIVEAPSLERLVAAKP
ncbi:MAG: pseudouridine synthase [Bdellovibrionales bacterium]